MQRQVDPVVGHPALREVIGADALAAVAGADHQFARARLFGLDTVAFLFKQPRAQHLQRARLVLVLRFFVLLDNHQTSRNMRDPHRRVRRVDVLATRSRRAVHVDAQVAVVDLDIDLFGLRQHRDGCRRGVDAASALGHRNPLDAVDAAFEFQFGEHADALDRGDDFLETADIGGIA